MEYVTFGLGDFDKRLFGPIRNIGAVKPAGGMWASEYTPDEEYMSAWERCVKEDLYIDKPLDYGIIFELTEDARVYTINNHDDLVRLWESYHFLTYKGVMIHIKDVLYDFEAMAKDYDVIKLTDEGQWKTRLTNPSLYGWDCECILIMNPDVVTNVVPFKK